MTEPMVLEQELVKNESSYKAQKRNVFQKRKVQKTLDVHPDKGEKMAKRSGTREVESEPCKARQNEHEGEAKSEWKKLPPWPQPEQQKKQLETERTEEEQGNLENQEEDERV